MLRRAKEPTQLEKALDKAQKSLDHFEIGSTEYEDRLRAVERLHEMQMKEKSDRVSKETVAMIAANLLGIILIIGHEKANVVSANALRMVTKLRTQ